MFCFPVSIKGWVGWEKIQAIGVYKQKTKRNYSQRLLLVAIRRLTIGQLGNYMYCLLRESLLLEYIDELCSNQFEGWTASESVVCFLRQIATTREWGMPEHEIFRVDVPQCILILLLDCILQIAYGI